MEGNDVVVPIPVIKVDAIPMGPPFNPKEYVTFSPVTKKFSGILIVSVEVLTIPTFYGLNVLWKISRP